MSIEEKAQIEFLQKKISEMEVKLKKQKKKNENLQVRIIIFEKKEQILWNKHIKACQFYHNQNEKLKEKINQLQQKVKLKNPPKLKAKIEKEVMKSEKLIKLTPSKFYDKFENADWDWIEKNC